MRDDCKATCIMGEDIGELRATMKAIHADMQELKKTTKSTQEAISGSNEKPGLKTEIAEFKADTTWKIKILAIGVGLALILTCPGWGPFIIKLLPVIL